LSDGLGLSKRRRASGRRRSDDILSDASLNRKKKKSSLVGSLNYSPKGFDFHSEGDVSDPPASSSAGAGDRLPRGLDDVDGEDKDTWVGCDEEKDDTGATYSSRKDRGPCDHSPVDFTSSYGKRALEDDPLVEDTAEAETASAPIGGESDAGAGALTSDSEPLSAHDENKLFKFLTRGAFN